MGQGVAFKFCSIRMDEKSTNRPCLGKILCWTSSALQIVRKITLLSCPKNPKLESNSSRSFIRCQVTWRRLKRCQKFITFWRSSWRFKLQQLFLWKKLKCALCIRYWPSSKRFLPVGPFSGSFYKLHAWACRHANCWDTSSRGKQQGVSRVDCWRLRISRWKGMGQLEKTRKNGWDEKIVLCKVLYQSCRVGKHSGRYEAIHRVHCQHIGEKMITNIFNF